MKVSFLLGGLLGIGVAAASMGQDFELSWRVVGSGGIARSTANDFELSATIGQPATGVLFGGGFELTSGFWFALAPIDCNEDGAVDLNDYRSFVRCLAGPTGYEAPECACYDANASGSVDLRDFAAAQIAFSAR